VWQNFLACELSQHLLIPGYECILLRRDTSGNVVLIPLSICLPCCNVCRYMVRAVMTVQKDEHYLQNHNSKPWDPVSQILWLDNQSALKYRPCF
jgi:hypothetical protein